MKKLSKRKRKKCLSKLVLVKIDELLSNVLSTNTKYKKTYAVNIIDVCYKGTFHSHINVYSKLINTTLHFIFSLDCCTHFLYYGMYFFP